MTENFLHTSHIYNIKINQKLRYRSGCNHIKIWNEYVKRLGYHDTTILDKSVGAEIRLLSKCSVPQFSVEAPDFVSQPLWSHITEEFSLADPKRKIQCLKINKINKALQRSYLQVLLQQLLSMIVVSSSEAYVTLSAYFYTPHTQSPWAFNHKWGTQQKASKCEKVAPALLL